MDYVGQLRTFTFTILNHSGVPVTTLSLGDFEINPTYLLPDTYIYYTIVFERNEQYCSDVLSLTNNGDGSYTLSYVPSSTGNDFIDVFDPVDGLRISDSADIFEPNFVSSTVYLNQNYGGTNNLLVIVPYPNTYVLYVFDSSQWVLGNQTPDFALGTTALTTNGDWVNSILVVVPGTYHIVIMDSTTTEVLYPFLVVSS